MAGACLLVHVFNQVKRSTRYSRFWNIKLGGLYGRGLLAGPRFNQVRSSTRYSRLEYLDNSITRQEVVLYPVFLLGNNRN